MVNDSAKFVEGRRSNLFTTTYLVVAKLLNTFVETRKMVNYSRTWWSQVKTWWKLALWGTDVQIVTSWTEYRGERLSNHRVAGSLRSFPQDSTNQLIKISPSSTLTRVKQCDEVSVGLFLTASAFSQTLNLCEREFYLFSFYIIFNN